MFQLHGCRPNLGCDFDLVFHLHCSRETLPLRTTSRTRSFHRLRQALLLGGRAVPARGLRVPRREHHCCWRWTYDQEFSSELLSLTLLTFVTNQLFQKCFALAVAVCMAKVGFTTSSLASYFERLKPSLCGGRSQCVCFIFGWQYHWLRHWPSFLRDVEFFQVPDVGTT